jgi:hypothetical protein
MHDFSLQFSFKGLHLAEHGQTARRTAHPALKLMEDLMQPLGSRPESRVVLSGCGIQDHGGSASFLDIMIVFAGSLGQ